LRIEIKAETLSDAAAKAWEIMGYRSGIAYTISLKKPEEETAKPAHGVEVVKKARRGDG